MNLKSVDSVIKKIIHMFGLEILQNPNKFALTFITLAPEMEKEENILTFALNQGVGKYFINCTESNLETNIEKVKEILGGIVADNTIDLIINWFLNALDLKLVDKTSGENIIRTFEIGYYFKEALEGDVLAQLHIGDCYYNGDEVEQDYKEAVKWYKKVAEQGYFLAEHYLAYAYSHGEGIDKNNEEAVLWYTKAAEQGYMKSQNSLGKCYYDGNGVEKDYAKAVELYTKSAKQGYALAQNNLGNCYYEGNGVEKDYAKAVELYTKSAKQGYALAQNNLGNCYYEGNGVEKDYAKAVELYTKSAKQGYALAQNNLGNCYYEGNGVEKDYAKAIELYTKSAQQGNKNAQKRVTEILGKDASTTMPTQNKINETKLIWKIDFEFNNKSLSEIDKYFKPIPYGLYLVGSTKFQNKLEKAINSYATDAKNDRVFLVYDDTLLENAKQGFVLTNQYLFAKHTSREAIKVSLRNIDSFEINDNYLILNYLTNDFKTNTYKLKFSSDINCLKQFGNILNVLIEYLV